MEDIEDNTIELKNLSINAWMKDVYVHVAN